MNRFGFNQISTILSRYEKQYSSLLNHIGKFPSLSVNELALTNAITSKGLPNKELLVSITNQVNRLAAVIDKTNIPTLLDSTNRFISAQIQYKEREKKYVVILATCGYPPLWDIPVHYIRLIIKKYEEMGIEDFKEYLNSWIISFYTSEIFHDMIERWETVSIVKKRIHILKDSLKAHLNEDYTLSIPTILPQIEGTLRDYDYNGTQLSKKTISGFIDLLLQDKDEYLPVKGLIIDE